MTTVEGELTRLRDRTMRLHRLTARLSTALHLDEIAAIIMDEGTGALEAQSGGLWQVHGDELVLIRTRNYPDAAIAQVARVPLVAGRPITDAVLEATPIWLASRDDYERRYPESFVRMRALTQPASYATAALPVLLDATAIGVIALTFAGDRAFDDDERLFLAFVASHCAQAFERARLYRAERDARERAQFLTSASTLLGGSLDYEETLRNVAALAVPKIGSWCGVELLEPDGTTKSVAVAHVDPAKVELARTFRERYPTPADADTGVRRVLRTGKAELFARISDAMLVAGARDPDHLAMMRALELLSVMIVPIMDRGRAVGAVTFVMSEPDRPYTAADVAMAEQLAERAGAAIGNALLYEQAQAAVRLRDEFMVVAGHELRTPLAAMTLHHQALASLPDTVSLDKVRERGTKLVRQSDRMARLVEELLDVSRLSAGRLDLERTTFDLADLVREICERMGDAIERTGARLSLTTEPAVGDWDRGRLDQIVTNLISNAIKYGRGSPITVAVAREGGDAVLTVRDGGIGIAVADQPRIFRRFERAVSSRNYAGLGLGLWITSQLVEAHGGSIVVASQPDRGATFTVRLPA